MSVPSTVSNPDKVLWPEMGFTKGQMIDYYQSVAPALLPHLRDRPLTLRRYPDGVEGWYWFQHQCPNPPPWMSTRAVPGTSREAFEYCVVNDLPSLVWVANLASIELHPLLALGDRLDEPSMVVFDLDPVPPAGILECCRMALRLRRLLAELDLMSFPKTSGATGLHVYVPLNSPHTYRQTRAMARRLARRLVTEVPELATDRRNRALRMGKVLLDWSQNNPAKSMVSVYSLRATEVPSVSTPLTWSEVEQALETDDPNRLRFGPAQVLERLDGLGDLFGPVVQTKQQIPS